MTADVPTARPLKTILVADDEVVLTEILRAVFEDAGYHVMTVGDGREALRRLRESRPDLVLCDVMMPLVDGREVCRTMNADPTLRDIPLVLMSAAPNAAWQEGCQYAAFILKPFDLDKLLGLVDQLTQASVR